MKNQEPIYLTLNTLTIDRKTVRVRKAYINAFLISISTYQYNFYYDINLVREKGENKIIE